MLGVLICLVILAASPRTELAAAVYDVTTYGAVANDGLNDLAAINAAITAASPGDTVLFPTGTFSIAGSIAPKSGITIAGVGRDSTSVQYIGGSGNPMVNLGNVSSVEMTGFTLDGNNSVYALQGVNAYGGSGHNLHNLRIKNLVANADFGPHAIYFSGAVTNSQIVDNLITNIGTTSVWGSGIRMLGGSSGNQVLGNTITNTGRGGIFVGGSTDEVIRNNTVSGSGQAAGAPALGIEIWGGGDRSLVEDNTVDQWLSVDNSSRVAVRRNVIDRGYAGLEFATAGSDNVFTDNTVTGGAHIGISVSGPGVKQRVLWAHNTISASTTWGTQIQSDAGGVQQMYFYGNTFEGATGVGALYPNQGNGFRFNPNDGTILNVTLDSNTITANANIGIQSGDWTFQKLDKLKVIDNTITNNGGPAFTPDFGTVGPFFGNDLSWSGNTVSGNGSNYQPPSKGSFFDNPPSASILAPASFVPGQPVSFAFDYAGPHSIGNILWDLGDGLPETVSNPVHVYDQGGTYRVNLVIWDALGRAAHDEIVLNALWAGDANSDGHVDYGDLSLLAPFYGLGPGMTWLNGDFDGDGFVNWDDIDLMAANFGLTPTSGTFGVSAAELSATLQTMIPEPSIAAAIVTILLCSMQRRPRGRQ